MRLLLAETRTPRPWKNGGGLTMDVATFPEGAGLDDFEWRVSLAEVASSGPFSYFANIDRWLFLLEGALRLTVMGQGQVTLHPGDWLAFEGDVATRGDVLQGPVRDLNVMARRGCVRLEAVRLEASPVGGREQLLVALAPTRVGEHLLARLDAVLMDRDDPITAADGAFILIGFERVEPRA